MFSVGRGGLGGHGVRLHSRRRRHGDGEAPVCHWSQGVMKQGFPDPPCVDMRTRRPAITPRHADVAHRAAERWPGRCTAHAVLVDRDTPGLEMEPCAQTRPASGARQDSPRLPLRCQAPGAIVAGRASRSLVWRATSSVARSRAPTCASPLRAPSEHLVVASTASRSRSRRASTRPTSAVPRSRPTVFGWKRSTDVGLAVDDLTGGGRRLVRGGASATDRLRSTARAGAFVGHVRGGARAGPQTRYPEAEQDGLLLPMFVARRLLCADAVRGRARLAAARAACGARRLRARARAP